MAANLAAGLAVGFARAAYGLLAPWKHVGLKATGVAADFAMNDGNLSKGFLSAAKDTLDGDMEGAAEELTSSVQRTVENTDQIRENASNIRETASNAVTFASDVAEGKNPFASGDGEGGVGGLFNSVMSGDIFNMDNAKTAGKWGLGGFLLYKIFDWLKDSFTGGNKDNENNSGGGISSALTLAVVIGAGAFIYNKYGDDIKNGLGIGEDTPKVASVEQAPRPQNLDNALQGYDM